MGTNHNPFQTPLFLALTTMLLAACAQSEEVKTDLDEEEAATAITFDTYLQQNQPTRATYPNGSLGTITNDELEETGFGVYTYYSGNTKFSYSAAEVFNFMYNQQVAWDETHSYWAYSPIKYWPNDNNPADDKDAAGSQLYNYLSFYAYAPYNNGADKRTEDLDNDGSPDADGIIYTTPNTTAAGESYLTYRTNSMKPSTSVDLLWAAQPNLYKMKASGEGYTDGHVTFNFIHALSKLTVTVQGLFDHINNEDQSPQYPIDVDESSKILIESVTITSPTLYKQGNMYLAPRPDNANVPYWTFDESNKTTLDFSGSVIKSTVRYDDGVLTDQDDPEDAKDDFKELLPTGVTHTQEYLFANQTDPYYIFPPTSSEQPLTVNVVYYTITYDELLTLNDPKYFSIVRNDVTYTSSKNFTFEPNKIYVLHLQPGLTSIKFEVEKIDEWGHSVILDAVVKEWQTETHEYNVE